MANRQTFIALQNSDLQVTECIIKVDTFMGQSSGVGLRDVGGWGRFTGIGGRAAP